MLPTAAIVLISVAGLVIVGLFVYWLLFVTEGAYLGERVVVWLYDLYAGRYDAIKDWDMGDEIYYLAEPFVASVGDLRRPPLILDVAAGTGRLARSVEAAGTLPDAQWVLLDASARMLKIARDHLSLGKRGVFIQHSASQLPFDDEFFDVVACLEALEFMPQPEAVVSELIRVLRPGGLLLITNRIGATARVMPGRTWSSAELYSFLQVRGQRNIKIRTFLVDYDWVSSVKAGIFERPGRAQDPIAQAQISTLASF
ncbi:MAG: class I SAM-dependent methyltransferase [Caldilineales bacterium]|nr:class I SAM-dependent methyltransferase [Caldilineales bacterium]